jgi:DedD protein
MGLFSFGNKEDAAPPRRGRNAAVAQRSSSRERRPERRADQETMLDPTLPEKQRARRRLIGAIALVLAAVVILPMVLDSHPKPNTDDIAIQIPNRDTPVAAKSPAATADADAENAAAPDEAPPANVPASPAGTAPTTNNANAAPASPKTAKGTVRNAPKAVANTAPENARLQPLTAAQMPPPDSNITTPGTAAAAPPGSRFVVQIGAFPTEQRARAWVTKLKAAGVPAYIEHRKQADGSDRVLLRAGPFADRASAESAVKKVRLAGLTAQSNDSQAAATKTAPQSSKTAQ